MVEANVTEAERLVRDFVAWENGDESKIDVVSESLDMYNPGLPGGEAHDREAVADYLHESRTGFPDVRFTIEELASTGNVVLAELRVTGTHRGSFKGIPPTGRHVEFGAMAKYVVADDTVVECHIHYDTRTLADQLGLSFPEVIGQLPKLVRGKLQTYR
ncbi:ester cyclase [Halovivax limisalsi]|uniref:ester cyclase n=1 Tax=Halovivax limisalsi TaxID=1453760 RepID=UPI001FFC974C|nr:ester cyclase [Halovivax limisalsi]